MEVTPSSNVDRWPLSECLRVVKRVLCVGSLSFFVTCFFERCSSCCCMGSQMLLGHGVCLFNLCLCDPLCHFLCCSFCPVSLCSLRPLAFVMLLLPSSGFHPPLLFVLLLALLPSFVCSFLCLLPLRSFRAWPVTPFLMPFSDITSVNSRDGHSTWSTFIADA